tara:strand:- start:70 stop:966 length:897 start_codon:yes stop_codon:yes gene_type:complete
MKIILTFLFIFITTYAFAKKYTKKCDGYCEGEKFSVVYWNKNTKNTAVINGEKIIKPTFTTNFATKIKDTFCAPFMLKIKRVSPTSKPYLIGYDINTCSPCPPGHNDSINKSGFCSVPKFSLALVYKSSGELGFMRKYKSLHEMAELGRKIPNEIKKNIPYSLDGLALEFFTFAISNKEDLQIGRVVEKGTSEMHYLINYASYKTPFKEQEIKNSFAGYADDKETQNIIDKYILEFQNNYGVFFSGMEPNNKFKENKPTAKQLVDISLLYDLIPTEKELKYFIKNFPKLDNTYIQTRN